jgi:2-hydroxychromene-2-carboxylate isomerase
MKTLDWYFDFISPFAYLQSNRLEDFAMEARIRCKPVLFAGLLAHWGQKGPAEMLTKRQFTFEHVAWHAHKNGIALNYPAMHPFVPLKLLRLSILLGSPIDVVRRLFAYVWVEGKLPTDEQAWRSLLEELGVAPDELEAAEVKQQLRANTDEAIALGVFGVPTCVIDGQRFWGFDATDMVYGRLADDPFFESDTFAAATQLPDGVHRKA